MSLQELCDSVMSEQFKETYEANIKVQLTSEPDRKFELVDDEVLLGFDISIEYRSWGIKDITIKPLGTITIDYLVGEDEAGTLNIDVDDTKIEYERGYSYIKPLWISLMLDADGNVTEKILHVSSM